MIVIVFVVLLIVPEGDGADFSLDSSSGVIGKRRHSPYDFSD